MKTKKKINYKKHTFRGRTKQKPYKFVFNNT